MKILRLVPLLLVLLTTLRAQVAMTEALRAELRAMEDMTPFPLRPGSFPAPSEIELARALRADGWIYVIATHDYPGPEQPPWMLSARDTKWTLGFWYNHSTGAKSVAQPKKKSGVHVGDGGAKIPQFLVGRRPPLPTNVEWMCSRDGGPVMLMKGRAEQEFLKRLGGS